MYKCQTVMIKKLMIVNFFGDLPEWFERWRDSIHAIKQYGYDYLLETDLDVFNDRVIDVMGRKSPVTYNTGKMWDWRPALGLLYRHELEGGGYGFWGHTDLDVVYGNISHFMPDSLLERYDILSDEVDYIGGHWTLYRNREDINGLFLEYPKSVELMYDPSPNGWVEREFTRFAEERGVRIKYHLVQATRANDGLRMVNGCLYQDDREVMLSHFRMQKRWPL